MTIMAFRKPYRLATATRTLLPDSSPQANDCKGRGAACQLLQERSAALSKLLLNQPNVEGKH